MNIEEYESTIDGIIEASIVFFWWATLFVTTAFLLTVIIGFINTIFIESESFYNIFLYGILPFSFLISIPMTIVLYYTRKAKKMYQNYGETIRLRDFWMGFATIVQINTLKNDKDKINEWIKENISYMHKRLDNERGYTFASRSDAMAFKLVWYE